MTNYLTVTLGIDATKALGGKRLTKKWLREYLRDHPEKDFRNHTHGVRGTYVNGEDCIRHDYTLEVHDLQGRSVAMVNFQTALDSGNEWGYQAVVR